MHEIPARSHIFVDESKAGAYYVVASALAAVDVSRARRNVQRLLLPGQKRIHFTDEKDARRKQLLDAFAQLDVTVHVYLTKGMKDRQARPLCLERLVEDLLGAGADRLCIERDDSTLVADKRILADCLRGRGDAFRYDFLKASEEPLLWISDAVAWCYQRGGQWKVRSKALVAGVTTVSA
ncbi:hypothetical protein [Kocuria sp.]|uniref:hypothetical protein n=1 Tax=Kocuria sp. TaxID=1871328 RepID=UPI0026E0ED97|nr:hypothetical protein [Kocuria sp.]MDO5619454.1 hypothetical protein [Kocuria sp.]